MSRLRWPAAAALVAMACNGDQGAGAGIMISLATDLTVPDSINEVGLYIEHIEGAKRTLVLSQEARPIYNEKTRQYELRFSASFAVQASKNPDGDSIRSRFVGFRRDGSVVAMREAQVRMPDRDVKSLPLPLLFVNEGRVVDTLGGEVAPTSTGVALQQVAQASRSEPFSRWRHPECGDDETLGDDGECTSIDIAVEDLDTLADATSKRAAIPFCLDTQTCFGGVRGRRELDINADCTVSAAGLGADELALAIRTKHGYGEVHAQPVPDTLYTFDKASGTVTLKRALCARAKAEGIGKAVISVKCAPMSKDTPICAPWQDGPAPGKADDTASFPDDPPPPGPVAEAGRDGSDEHDGSNSSDAADAAPEPQAFDRIVLVPAGDNVAYFDTFAARADGTIWTVMRTSDSGYGVVAMPDATVTHVTSFDFFPENAKLVLGVGDVPYLIPPVGFYRMPSVLSNQAFIPLKLGGGVDCETSSADAPNVFAVGVHEGHNVALYGGGSSGLQGVMGGVADEAHPECFHGDIPVAGDVSDELFRGASFAGKFRVPAHDSAELLAFDPGAMDPGTSTSLGPLTYGPDLQPVVFESLVDVGFGRSLLVGSGKNDIAGTDTLFYEVSANPDAPQPKDNPIHVVMDLNPTREVFGGEGVICARLEDSDGSFFSVDCFVPNMQPLRFGLDVPASDLRVYGDATHMYMAKACFTGKFITSVRVAATPWGSLNKDRGNPLLPEVCPNASP